MKYKKVKNTLKVKNPVRKGSKHKHAFHRLFDENVYFSKGLDVYPYIFFQ